MNEQENSEKILDHLLVSGSLEKIKRDFITKNQKT